jgi:hypothetical protein
MALMLLPAEECLFGTPSVSARISDPPANDSRPDWLKHTRRLDALWQPAKNGIIPDKLTCGAMAFAAIARIKLESVCNYFPELETRPWINRRSMERALRAAGRNFQRCDSDWPNYGLCLVHFVGPWTERAFPMAVLAQTHWVAVHGDYVYDVNWNGWLPKDNWEEIVVEELIAAKPRATGWQVMTGYEIMKHLSPGELQLWLRLAD